MSAGKKLYETNNLGMSDTSFCKESLAFSFLVAATDKVLTVPSSPKIMDVMEK